MNTPAGYFDDQYADTDDPWHLAERWYDQRKYRLTAAALPRPLYRRAFEPGCSVGALTELLADRCRRLLATDRVDRAVERARRNTAGLENVTVRQMVVPDEWPEGSFDLVVLSELLYYFGSADRGRILAHGTRSLEPGGHLVAVHWNHPVPEHTCTGRQIADELADSDDLGLLARYDDPDFTLTVHERRTHAGSILSPAQSEGLA
ncbi:class I SAM-dependent methyltransferase [Streptomyces sp. HUAS MG91]|uniref:Class I SAM-dependent methyltransferase n=1 Tax=Streptomyces tabacisoli TaxID=3156398 RepID=A0AAU8IL37_9ACTN